MATKPDELTCDDLTPEQRSFYVESELAGEDLSNKYPHIAHHLRHCPDCAEEMADLRRMLELAQEKLPQPTKMPTFDLSFLQSEQPVSIKEVAQGIVNRFFAEEAPYFDLISERFFAQVAKLRARQAAREASRPGWLEKLSGWLEDRFSWQPVPGMPLSGSKSSEDTTAPMTLKVLIAATRMEEVLSSHRASLKKGEALPEIVRIELADIGQETELPEEVVEELTEKLLGMEEG
jgi:hypothetical protein